jgi:hypothetical protein
MFALMAGVRGDDEPVVEPRGLPKNLAYPANSKAFL